MRLSIVAATLSLAMSAWAGIVIPPPPPGSACLSYPDTYPKPEGPSKRSLGITTLPRLWARDMLMSYRQTRADQPAESRQNLACACVPIGKKEAYGFYTKDMCPAQRGAYEACSVEFDGFRCIFGSLPLEQIYERFTDEKCNAAFPGTEARCSQAYPGYD